MNWLMQQLAKLRKRLPNWRTVDSTSSHSNSFQIQPYYRRIEIYEDRVTWRAVDWNCAYGSTYINFESRVFQCIFIIISWIILLEKYLFIVLCIDSLFPVATSVFERRESRIRFPISSSPLRTVIGIPNASDYQLLKWNYCNEK